ncbi:NAD-dependent epimerase/dehydratase [Phlyctochytrium arcticum]|nr:NAD-dependent epimerase/dehydratase [Phlyctochytrium arcticum]
MKVFITGASGWIGTATTTQLIQHGHTVLGLARSDASAQKLTALGAQVIRGDLSITSTLQSAARESDAIIHLGFHHDFSQYAQALQTDLAAIRAMGDAIAGSGKVFIGTSVVSGVGAKNYDTTMVRTEDWDDSKVEGGRIDAERVLFGIPGIRAAVVRLCPTVHGEGDQAFIPNLIEIAREKGFSAYVETGENLWPAVHVQDAATLFRLALESAKPGMRLHAVAETVTYKSIAEAIAKKLSIPTKSITQEDAVHTLGFLGMVIAANAPASSELTQKWLNWKPTHKKLLENLSEDYYFKPMKRNIF